MSNQLPSSLTEEQQNLVSLAKKASEAARTATDQVRNGTDPWGNSDRYWPDNHKAPAAAHLAAALAWNKAGDRAKADDHGREYQYHLKASLDKSGM